MIQPSRMPPRPLKKMTNCKNCGAPLKGSVCEYCGTFYMENHIYVNVNNVNVKRLIESMNRTPIMPLREVRW